MDDFIFFLAFPLIVGHFKSVVELKKNPQKVFQYSFFYSILKMVVVLEIHRVISMSAVT